MVVHSFHTTSPGAWTHVAVTLSGGTGILYVGKAVVETLSGSRSPAVLLKQHGVFAIGPSARAAVKAAVMCEDAARTVHLARQLGPVESLHPNDIDALYDRYQNIYGQ